LHSFDHLQGGGGWCTKGVKQSRFEFWGTQVNMHRWNNVYTIQGLPECSPICLLTESTQSVCY
jgi:hypothetical protein